jgi:hypothetical protein
MAGTLRQGSRRSEVTVRFYQEVFDDDGHLREVHHKFPVDLGHERIDGD